MLLLVSLKDDTIFYGENMNRDVILKNFFSKLKEAKAQNVRDVRLSLKEMDDLGYVLFELTSEFYDKIMSSSNKINKPNEGGDGNMLFSNSEPSLDGGSFK
jgi:hypothetical protein